MGNRRFGGRAGDRLIGGQRFIEPPLQGGRLISLDWLLQRTDRFGPGEQGSALGHHWLDLVRGEALDACWPLSGNAYTEGTTPTTLGTMGAEVTKASSSGRR